MNARAALFTVLLVVALVLQTSVFHELAFDAVVPDLVLLVVVGAGLARGAGFGMVTGFAAGLLVDLTPPADHFAGRWALALLVVGYLAGAIRPSSLGSRPTLSLAVATAAGGSFVGTSIYAMTGMLLHQTPSFGTVLTTILVGVVYDSILAVLVLPLVLRAFDRVEPA